MRKPIGIYFDGQKKVNLYDWDDWEAWDMITESGKTAEQLYFSSVAWLYRAVKDRSNTVGKMPFHIVKGGEEIDSSADYQNKLLCLPSPTTLFKKLEMSLTMTGRAYVRIERNRNGYVANLKYLVPTTITEIYDEKGELKHYERRKDSKVYEIPKDDIIPFYDTDYTTEAGHGSSSAAKAALISAGVLFNVDKFISNFFERGAIKATIFSTKSASREAADKLRNWIKDFISGNKNSWSNEVVNADSVNTTVIGEGLESLTNQALTTERRQNIAAAIGVPESRMWSSAANYATAQQDDKNYYNGTIIPECDIIQEGFNQYLFTAINKLAGYKLDFDYESLDVFQEDVQAQTDALTKLVTAGVPLVMAMDIVGMDLTDKQRAELEKIQAEKESRVEEVVEQTQTNEQPDTDDEREQVNVGASQDLANWQRKAIKAVKAGKDANVKFESDTIPDWLHDEISKELADCKTVDDVKYVFSQKREQGLNDLVGMLKDLMAVVHVSPQSASN